MSPAITTPQAQPVLNHCLPAAYIKSPLWRAQLLLCNWSTWSRSSAAYEFSFFWFFFQLFSFKKRPYEVILEINSLVLLPNYRKRSFVRLRVIFSVSFSPGRMSGFPYCKIGVSTSYSNRIWQHPKQSALFSANPKDSLWITEPFLKVTLKAISLTPATRSLCVAYSCDGPWRVLSEPRNEEPRLMGSLAANEVARL